MASPVVNLYTDGACRGNPGQGGAGAVLVDEGGEIVAARETLTRDFAQIISPNIGLSFLV